MSDPATSGGPSEASAATAGSASSAASSGTPAPIGSFGTAKGSGLLRGKRPSAPAAPAASSNAAPSGYQPSSLEVIRPQSEYKNPFTGETSVPTVVVNEPVTQAAPLAPTPVSAPTASSDSFAKPPAPAEALAKEDAPLFKPTPVAVVTPSVQPSASAQEDLFPFTLSGSSERKPAPLPTAVPPRETKQSTVKPELNILPTEQVKRPAVSWGESAQSQHDEPRARRDERPTFRPERREPRPFESREPRRDQSANGDAPREQSPNGEQRHERHSRPRDFSRDERPAPAAAASQKKSGGFFAWLKGLFAEKPAAPEVRTGERDENGRDGGQRHNRRRHRGGRGRGQGGFNGENRGPREQPRDPRDEAGPSQEGGENRGEHQGEHRHEGGGGQRRHRGGRGRNRDDRGPRPEGQQGGGAI